MLSTPTSIETCSGIFVDLSNPKPEEINTTDIFWALSRLSRFGGHATSHEIYSVGQHSVLVANLVSQLVFGKALCDMNTLELNTSFSSDSYLATSEVNDSWRMFVQTTVQEHQRINVMQDVAELITSTKSQKLRCVMDAFRHDWAEAYLVDVPTPIKRYSNLGRIYSELEHRVMDAIYAALPIQNTVNSPIMDTILKWGDLQALSIEANHLIPSKGKDWNLPTKPLISLYTEFKVHDQVRVRELLRGVNELLTCSLN